MKTREAKEIRQVVGADNALSIPSDLAAMSTEQLRHALAESLGMTAASLMRSALILRALEERGEDLSDLKVGILDYLRLIAYGQVIPEAVVRFSGSPGLMRTVASLPLPDQKRLAAGEPVTLVIRKDDGSFDRRLADPLRMPREYLNQVFARGRIKDEAEQILSLESSGSPKEDPAKPKQFGRVRADSKRGGLVIGKRFVPTGDVLAALAELHPGLPPDSDLEPVTAIVRLSPIEHQRLKYAALRSKSNASALIYRALMAAGLLAPGPDE